MSKFKSLTVFTLMLAIMLASCASRALPSCFDYMTDEEKSEQYEAINKMTDEEWNTYLSVVEKEPAITADMQKIADENDGTLAGMEYRVKSPSSTYEKMYDRETKTEINEINDLIRYTVIYDPDTLADGTNNTLDNLEAAGYTVARVKNTWDVENTPYRGINTTIQTSDGQSFEVQFHTQESFDYKNGEDHEIYEERRQLSPDDPRAVELEKKSIAGAAALERPKDIEKVVNR